MATRLAATPSLARDALLVGTAAATSRAVYLAAARPTPLFDYLHLDPLYYVDWGRRIAAGDVLGTEVFEQSPLYPYLLGLFFSLVGERLLLLRALQLALGAAACVGIAVLGRMAFDRRVGLVAGLLAAVYGPFLFYEGQVMKSFLNHVLAAGALVCLYRGRRPGWGWPWLGLAGLGLGLLALVRANALVLAPVLAVWVAWDAGTRHGDRRRGLAGAAAVLLGAAIAIAPVTVRNVAVSGEAVLVTSGGGEVFYIGNWDEANGAYLPPEWVRPSPAFEHGDFRAEARRRTGRDLTRAQASRYWFTEGMRSIRADPPRWARLELRKLALFWNARELPDNYSYDVFARFIPLLRFLPGFGVVAPLALVGMALSLRRWRELLPLYLLLGAYLAGVLLFFNFSRFRLPALPVLLVFAAAAVVAAYDALRERALRRAGVVILGGALLAIPLQVDLTSATDAPGQEELLVGYAWLDAGRPDDALPAFTDARRRIQAFRRAGGAPPGLQLGSACYGQGAALQALGRPAEALEPLRCAVALSPEDPGPLEALAGALGGAGRPAEARGALERRVALGSVRFATWFDLGELAFEEGDAAGALRWFELGRERAEGMTELDLADYHFGVALVHLQLRADRERALPHLREALRLNPDHEQAAAIRAILAGGDG